MEKEKHYFCVRLPVIDSWTLEDYRVIGGKLHQTQACSGKKAANNVIFHHGGENYALISRDLHEKYGDLSKFTIDLDEALKVHYQHDFWKNDFSIRSLDGRGLAKKIQTKLEVRVVNGEGDCLRVANEFIHYRHKHPLNQ